MTYDIYGQPLRPGYCEVHPKVGEPYPCMLCRATDNPAGVAARACRTCGQPGIVRVNDLTACADHIDEVFAKATEPIRAAVRLLREQQP